jgi:hypothetical protein
MVRLVWKRVQITYPMDAESLNYWGSLSISFFGGVGRAEGSPTRDIPRIPRGRLHIVGKYQFLLRDRTVSSRNPWGVAPASWQGIRPGVAIPPHSSPLRIWRQGAESDPNPVPAERPFPSVPTCAPAVPPRACRRPRRVRGFRVGSRPGSSSVHGIAQGVRSVPPPALKLGLFPIHLPKGRLSGAVRSDPHPSRRGDIRVLALPRERLRTRAGFPDRARRPLEPVTYAIPSDSIV